MGGPAAALWAGEVVMLTSFIFSLVLITFDKWVDSGNLENHSHDIEETIELKEVFNLSYMFWLLCLVCVTLYGAFLPFNNIASGFLISSYFKDMDKREAESLAGLFMSVPFIIGAILTPIFGIIIDRIGKRSHFIILSSFSSIISFSLFFYIQPLIPLALLGITYSVFASTIWPTVSLICNKRLVGAAYGVMTSLQNLGLSIFPMMIATIFASYNKYENVSSITLSCLGVILFINHFFTFLILGISYLLRR